MCAQTAAARCSCFFLFIPIVAVSRDSLKSLQQQLAAAEALLVNARLVGGLQDGGRNLQKRVDNLRAKVQAVSRPQPQPTRSAPGDDSPAHQLARDAAKQCANSAAVQLAPEGAPPRRARIMGEDSGMPVNCVARLPEAADAHNTPGSAKAALAQHLKPLVSVGL